MGDPRLQHRHARRPGPVKHSKSLLRQEQTHSPRTAARDHSAAVSSLKSFSAGSSLGGPAWTPDRRFVVFDHRDGPGDSAPSGLWAVGARGDGLHRLNDPQGASDAGPIISPDGRQIVFLRWRGSGEAGVAQTVVMNADGANVKVLFDYPGDTVGNAVWSPDSTSIAFNVGDQLWIINARTGVRERTLSFTADGLLDWQALPRGPRVRCADRGSAAIPSAPITTPPTSGDDEIAPAGAIRHLHERLHEAGVPMTRSTSSTPTRSTWSAVWSSTARIAIHVLQRFLPRSPPRTKMSPRRAKRAPQCPTCQDAYRSGGWTETPRARAQSGRCRR